MTRGRKPQPTHLKALRGNPGRRPGNPQEPKLPAGVPDCPEHLTGEARAEWFRVCSELKEMGLLTRAERPALMAYCDTYALYVDCKSKYDGPVMKTQAGNVIQNPVLGVMNRAKDDMRKWLVEFGMTPSARTRVRASGEQKDELDEFLDEAG